MQLDNIRHTDILITTYPYQGIHKQGIYQREGGVQGCSEYAWPVGRYYKFWMYFLFLCAQILFIYFSFSMITFKWSSSK